MLNALTLNKIIRFNQRYENARLIPTVNDRLTALGDFFLTEGGHLLRLDSYLSTGRLRKITVFFIYFFYFYSLPFFFFFRSLNISTNKQILPCISYSWIHLQL